MVLPNGLREAIIIPFLVFI